MRDICIPSLHELFEQYRELSRSLHDEAKAVLGTWLSDADTAVAARLENRAVELDRVIAQYERRRWAKPGEETVGYPS